MPSAGKKKGNTHESWMADALTKWYGQPFKRMPASGALRWKGASFVYGDILPPEDFPFIIECKHYKHVDLDEILRLDPDRGYITWWYYSQLLSDVQRCREETGQSCTPMLLFKQNNRPVRIGLPSKFASLLDGKMPYLIASLPNKPSFLLADFYELLGKISPEQLLSAR